MSAADGNLNSACKEALNQIDERNYEEAFLYDDVETILKYGIACYKKGCRVEMGEKL